MSDPPRRTRDIFDPPKSSNETFLRPASIQLNSAIFPDNVSALGSPLPGSAEFLSLFAGTPFTPADSLSNNSYSEDEWRAAVMAIFEIGLKQSTPKAILDMMIANDRSSSCEIDDFSNGTTQKHKTSSTSSNLTKKMKLETHDSISFEIDDSGDDDISAVTTEHIKSHLQKFRQQNTKRDKEIVGFFQEFINPHLQKLT